MKRTLKVLAAPDRISLVANIDALYAVPPQRRFIGWNYDAALGEAGGWVRKEEPEELPYKHEYVKAIKEGDLIPADAETAHICGLQFSKQI